MLRIADDSCDRVAMGKASRRKIAEWSPERFGRNLICAANYALRAPKTNIAPFDSMILKALIARSSF